MKASVILSTLAASLAMASPVAKADKRADVSFWACNGRNWTGQCLSIAAQSGACNPIPANFDNQISSVQPAENSFCYFFVDGECSIEADFFHVGFPGVADLSVTPVNGPEGSTRDFEDKLSSYRCTLEA